MRPEVSARQTGERSQQRGLARAIGADDGDGPSGVDREVGIEGEPVEFDTNLRGERHRRASQRSRRLINTMSDTNSNTSDSTIAASGLEPSSLM